MSTHVRDRIGIGLANLALRITRPATRRTIRNLMQIGMTTVDYVRSVEGDSVDRRQALAAEAVGNGSSKPRPNCYPMRHDDESAPTCTACRGRGSRLHGWAICPRPCEDCGGTGLSRPRPVAPPINTSVERGSVVIERDGAKIPVAYDELRHLIRNLDRHHDALSDARDA